MNKLIIFDVDGVLEKEDRLAKARHDALIAAIAKKLGVSMQNAEKKYFEQKELFAKSGKHASVTVFMSFGFIRKEFFDILGKVDQKKFIEKNKNCDEMLKEVSKCNKIVTYTNSPHKSSVETLKILKIYNYIDKVYSSENFEESKPSLKNLKHMMEDTGYTAENTVSVGNSYEKDIVPAKHLGMTTILYDPGQKYKDKDVKCADFVVKDLMEIALLV